MVVFDVSLNQQPENLNMQHKTVPACRDVMNKLASALEGGTGSWQGVPYLRIDGATDSRDRLQVSPPTRHLQALKAPKTQI